MRPLLALSVLVVVLSVVLEGPAPAQAAPDVSSTFEQIPGKLKEFGNTLEDKTREAIDHIKNSDFATKTRNWFSETFTKVKEKLRDTFS